MIDEDVTMQQDLKSIKVSPFDVVFVQVVARVWLMLLFYFHFHTPSQTSFRRKRSIEGSNLDPKENNFSSKKYKPILHDKSSDASKTTGLSVALMASCHSTFGRKRKTTFLSGKETRSTFSRQSSSSSKSVSLSHVVFVAGDNSQSASQLPDFTGNDQSLLGSAKLPRGHSKAGKASKNVVPGGSLWSRVCSKNFRT